MSITREAKAQVIQDFGKSPNDTGSAEVQIAVLSKRIETLTEHLRANKKDHAGRRGLLTMVSRRRRLLNYLKKNSEPVCRTMLERLGIRK